MEHIMEKVNKIKTAILIPAYKEPLNIIERMLIACSRLEKGDIDLKTWLCVDGMSKEDEENITKLANKYNINISQRSNRSGYRAGALNFCIQNKIDPDTKYIIVLDIDQAPKPEMVNVLVREMEKEQNKDIHFIMFPQIAENKDKNAISKASNTLQRYDYYFNRRIRSMTNSAFVVGTNWICRAEFIRKYPFEEGSIVEDQASSVGWHSKGAKIKVINKELALGLAPDTIDSWRAQQARWSYGAIYNLRYLKKNWHDLTIWQKIDYFSVMMWYTYAIPMVLSMLIPLAAFSSVMTNINPLIPIGLLILNIFVSIYPLLFLRGIGIRDVFQTACVQQLCLDIYLKAMFDNIRGKRFEYVVSDKTGKTSDINRKIWFSYLLVLATGIGIIYALDLNPPTLERVINGLEGYPLRNTTYIIYWLILGIFWIWGAIYFANKSKLSQETIKTESKVKLAKEKMV